MPGKSVSRYSMIALTLAAVLVAACSAQAQVFPSLQLTSFDEATGTYEYTLTCPANSTYPFGYLQIDTMVPNQAPTGPWTILGPFVNGTDLMWPRGHIRWDIANGLDSAVWDPFSRGDVIPPYTAWQGVFILVVPQSQPFPGKAATKDGQIGSYKVHDVLVPGPRAVPSVPPVTTITVQGTLGDNDWYVSQVTVELSVDIQEGLLATYYWLDDGPMMTYDSPFDVAADGEHEVTAYSEDEYGNVEDPPVSAAFKIDTTDPVVNGAPVTQPNANGWYNSDVVIAYTAYDATSGLAAPESAEPGDSVQFYSTVSATGGDVTDSVTVTDRAGNTASAAVTGLKIDKTAPVITVTSAPTGGCHVINYEDAVIQFDAVDSLSGIDGLPWAVIDIAPTDGWAEPVNMTVAATDLGSGSYEIRFPLEVPGEYTVVLRAQDMAGNIGEASAPLSFGAGGFTVEWLPPISLMETYVMQDGSTVPVKFRLVDPCNNNAYVNNYLYTLKVIDSDSNVWMTVEIPQPDSAIEGYHVNVRTRDDNNDPWPLGDYTVVIEGPGIWDMVSGPYKSRYGLDIVEMGKAQGKGRR